MKKISIGNMKIKIFETKSQMGAEAASDISQKIHQLLKNKDEIRIVFAAAPSQDDVLKSLFADKTIEWNRISAFNMDEYNGLAVNDPRSFKSYLRKYFDRVALKSANYIEPTHDESQTCNDYITKLLAKDIDLVVMGIGENGHIAFNDPEVADFHDPLPMKKVKLDDRCRMQQVKDKCFNTVENVPCFAYTLTIPTLLKAKYKFCIVSGKEKADAVQAALKGPVTEQCPASILRTEQDVILYLDTAAYSLLDK